MGELLFEGVGSFEVVNFDKTPAKGGFVSSEDTKIF